MTLQIIRAIALIVGALSGAYSLFLDARGRGEPLRWYDRTIRLLGSILLLGVGIGGMFMWFGKWK